MKVIYVRDLHLYKKYNTCLVFNKTSKSVNTF